MEFRKKDYGTFPSQELPPFKTLPLPEFNSPPLPEFKTLPLPEFNPPPLPELASRPLPTLRRRELQGLTPSKKPKDPEQPSLTLLMLQGIPSEVGKVLEYFLRHHQIFIQDPGKVALHPVPVTAISATEMLKVFLDLGVLGLKSMGVAATALGVRAPSLQQNPSAGVPASKTGTNPSRIGGVPPSAGGFKFPEPHYSRRQSRGGL